MADPHQPPRREFTRVSVSPQAFISADGREVPGPVVLNLSLKGLLLQTPSPPPVGTACDVRLHLADTDILVHASGRVVRHATGGCAIEFTEIVGLDSFEHLRNLVLLNSRHPDQVEEEFHNHLGLKRET
jgi:PilZ domain